MVPRTLIEEAVKRNLAWFRNSGVMNPADGSRGVAERLVRLDGNEAAEKIRANFPAMTERGSYAVLEHRRPDCNFETALLFLLAGKYFEEKEHIRTGENLLAFLFRSGLLRDGLWNWHSEVAGQEFWFDDNGWNSAVSIAIGRLHPELDRRFGLVDSGRWTAGLLGAGLARCMESATPLEHGRWPDPERLLLGEPRQPHWGAPPAIALLLAGKADAAEAYFRRAAPLLETQSPSEHAYLLLAVSIAARLDGRRFFREEAERLLAYLCALADPCTGTLPSGHCEAPGGRGVADLIYTDNWFFAALALHPETEAFRRLLGTMLAIQDRSGCFRGMYDFNAGCWGGGDRYEGGANSIYTGWTNAVIALALVFTLTEGVAV